MWFCLFRLIPAGAGGDFFVPAGRKLASSTDFRPSVDAPKRKKPQVSGWKPQLQRLMKPQPINALSALRDGVPCSDSLW
jgi:hypothetical protein